MVQIYAVGNPGTCFPTLAGARAYRRKYGGKIYTCAYRPGVPSASQDWRPVRVRG